MPTQPDTIAAPETTVGQFPRRRVDDYIVEIVSDSGEGAQKAGQAFGAVCAKMGNGVWTVEIIPAEIQPPARSIGSASGNRIRISSRSVTNMGDRADLVVAFNEQVLYARILQDACREGTVILLESKWAEDSSEVVRDEYARALADLAERGYKVVEIPMERECLKFTENPRRGKNMFVLGMLCHVCGRDLDKAIEEVTTIFKRKGEKVVSSNVALLRAGFEYAQENLGELLIEIPSTGNDKPLVVMNGNQAVGLGIMASGMEMVAMYPITPATSASHYLADVFAKTGGFVHQAEDEIAAVGFACGASYAGNTACTITSGPGLALKTEFLGLAVMAELPLVVVVVQRGGPSTGLPTKVEQGDLLSVLFGTPGDAPKIVLAPSTIEECFHFVVTARKLAEDFRTPVVLLTDANLATGVQPFPRPEVTSEWMANPLDQSPWDESIPPYSWNPDSGISPRPIPGQVGGEYVLTGLNHSEESKVAYDSESNQKGCEMRSRKLAALQKTLRPPAVYGDADGGELLVIGWGSTRGSIEEAIDQARADGLSVSSLHLRFLSPLEPGLEEILGRFSKLLTIEINYSDPVDAPLIDVETRRHAQLARLLRSHLLKDIDCWSNVHGQPLSPTLVREEIRRRLGAKEGN